MLAALENLENQLTWIIDRLVSALLFCVLAIITCLVILRYLFDSSIIGANEVLRMMFVYASMLGISVALLRREHINIPVFINILPDVVKRLLDMISFLLIGILNVIMVYQGYFWIEKTGRYLMPSLQMPQIYFQYSVLIGCTLSVLFCLTRFLVLTITFFNPPSERS